MTHFNKPTYYNDEEHYDMCDACKTSTNCDYLMSHNNTWVCPECYYQICEKGEQETHYNLDPHCENDYKVSRIEDEIDEILDSAYNLSEDEIAKLRNTRHTCSVKDNPDFDYSIHNFDHLQEIHIDTHNTKTEREEQEDFWDKQYEEYLRLNTCDEDEDIDDLPPLGSATAEKVARTKEILDNYIDIMEQHNKNSSPQYDTEDINRIIDKYIMNNRIQSSAKKEELDDDSKPLMTRCRCDDSPRKYITCCECGECEEEMYSFRYKSSLYCNTCAYEVCGIMIDKPSYPIKDYSKSYNDETRMPLLDEDGGLYYTSDPELDVFYNKPNPPDDLLLDA